MQVRSPVAFLLFNRPDHTARVFEVVRKVQPRRLFIIADGARDSHERTRVDQARTVVEHIDWDCHVERLYSDENLGCRKRVSSGLDWVFSKVDRAIILEDDCVPSLDFFPFCDQMLARYEHDRRVFSVTGDNFLLGDARIEHSYSFIQMPAIWGWATWRRAWELYDVTMSKWRTAFDEADLEQVVRSPAVARWYAETFDRVKRGDVDTWDFQLHLSAFLHRGLTIFPRTNLVSNIGFGALATHTTSPVSPLATLPVGSIDFPLEHPPEVRANPVADAIVFGRLMGYSGAKLKEFAADYAARS